MRNKLNKNLQKQGGRMFSVEVDTNSPEFKQLQEQFNDLNKLAKEIYGEKNGKKVKDASKEKGVGNYLFGERDEEYGNNARLKFIVYNIREKDVTTEEGTRQELYEVLSPIYENDKFTYKLDNNGNKQYVLESGKIWTPLSENTIDVKCSLVAGYNSTDNRVSIRLKADEVRIVESNVPSGGKNKMEMITLEGVVQKNVKKVEYTQPSKDEAEFTTDELVALDVTSDMSELDV
jgi:hypothetical protein